MAFAPVRVEIPRGFRALPEVARPRSNQLLTEAPVMADNDPQAAAAANVALRDFDAEVAAKHAELTALLAPGVLPIPSFPAAPPNAVHGVALAALQGTRGEAAAPTQAVRGVAAAAPPRFVLSGAAASFLASHPISPYPVSAVSTKLSGATPGHTDGVKATNEAEAAAPP